MGDRAVTVAIHRSLAEWAFLLFLSGVAAMAFSIAAGETLLGAAMLLLAISLARNREWPAWPRLAWGWPAFMAVAALACLAIGENAPGRDAVRGNSVSASG